jgi:hypothetical protein
MSTLTKANSSAVDVKATADTLLVVLADGREISAPLSWLPRLMVATEDQRQNWRLIGAGEGIHWPAAGEDVSVASLLRLN